ncbi:hypothetical protein B0H13DRAFT_2553117 [Mycena leptocephala]|nr:hypothetical protein B0H13DRAFT_2553117 [Mycena leptocephala]
MSSAALPSSLHFLRATGPRCANPFTSHLIPLRVLCTIAAVFVIAVHLPFILALILFAGGGVMRSGAVGVIMHLARARGGEEREAGAGPRHCSSTFSWRRGPEASGSARSDIFVDTLLVLLLPLLVAAAQLPRTHLPLPGFGVLRLRECAHRHPPDYLVLLRISACLAHWARWCWGSGSTLLLYPLLLFDAQFPVLSSPFSLPFCIYPYSHHVIPQFSGSYFEAGTDSRLLQLHDVGPPCRPCAHRTEDSTRAQYRRTARHVAHPRVGAAGPVRRALQDEHMHTHDCPACHGSSSAATGTPRRSVGRRPPSSSRLRARGRRRLGKEGGRASGLSSTAVRCAAHAHCAAETLDESATYRHPHPRQMVHPRMGAVRQAGGERGARALSVRIPTTGPPAATTRWEVEGDGEGTRARARARLLPALGFLRPDYDDGDRDRDRDCG